ncbi:hypothetical protein SARC_00148 [Sphaeroforma arctica JP610]|uniref:Uncharacterized protein n=1 Tax=Sphaeroforma arctica JP610 TaxID=667725 RepID=A0A0L0GG26_9EUKA|nr:hypothetical protein SARC_00148 [Sphaeroforma arctica JP610]KNC87776.1 hypothetical protein SARC_00148 [Sphaeroforma arctica JP610]|eukprot:XP_014161678.1 hypothetical protein SARC_00148 [Sphaeroforma arctica JP610]
MSVSKLASALTMTVMLFTAVNGISTHTKEEVMLRIRERRQSVGPLTELSPSVLDVIQQSGCKDYGSRQWCDDDIQCSWTGYSCIPDAAVALAADQWERICQQYDDQELCETPEMYGESFGGTYYCKWFGSDGNLQGCQPDVLNEEVNELCDTYPFRSMCRNVPYCKFIENGQICRTRFRSELSERLDFDNDEVPPGGE